MKANYVPVKSRPTAKAIPVTKPRKVTTLALLGGEPNFQHELHVGRPNVPQGNVRRRLLEMIEDILDRRWLTNHGPVVEVFEQEIAQIVGARNAIAVCNATQGLQVLARACDLTGEIIVPSFTFIATAHALSWIGLRPVFADVELATHTLDPARIEQYITPRTSAILATHLWGTPCRTAELNEIARRHGLQLLYDAAHAFGCTDRGRMIGTFGHGEVFSFHATKFVNAGEGGAITTNDDALASRLRRMINFGFEGYDWVGELGTNAKMNELSAAMGLASMALMEDIIDTNRTNYLAYRAGLNKMPGLRMLRYDEKELRNYQYIVVELNNAPLTRDELLAVLWSEGVKARRYFYPGCHRMEPYRYSAQSLPVTEWLSDRVMVLPTGTSVTVEEIATICQLIGIALEHADAVRVALKAARATRIER